MQIYFTVDDDNRLIPVCDYNESIEPNDNWFTGEISAPAYEEHGIPLWKYENGACAERTTAEIQADIDALPEVEPTEEEQLRADVDFILMMIGEE